MTSIPKTYDSEAHEDELYRMWEESGAFAPSENEEKTPYVIMMPPPNATGQLHLGHATMLAIEDILIRFKRMQGHATLYLPGTDHAAIATQSVVEKQLQDGGMVHPLKELGREGLLEKIREFVEQSKNTIRGQVRKMGTSCDWSRERYTFSEELNHAVTTIFEMMYKDGLIYRGGRSVNWDPKMQTTVSDDELERVEETTKWYTLQYGPFQIGTSRLETKFADVYVVVHPDDERYKKWKHLDTFECEWINGSITATVIKDKIMDMELGTGAMTINPHHDANDFELCQRHGIMEEQVIGFDGKLLSVAGEFAGMGIEEAHPKIEQKFRDKGLLVSVDENYLHSVAVNYRGKGVVEPQIMEQWFVDVNKKVIDWKGEKRSIKEVLQDVVRSEMIRIVPQRFEKIYFHWIDNLRDWCISRQIIWGHRIPVWYREGEVKVQAESPGDDWTQDEDTLDTWFSSGLWTFSTLGWPEKTEDLLRFTPSDVLETGYDILFFWVARMILMSTYALRASGFSEEQSIPFKNVYLHGLIRDIHGKKMSKSRPETCIDPLDMIAKYGTDAIRLSLLIGSTPGNDMRLYEEKISGYRNFVNKIWNGARFVMMNLESGAESIDLSQLSRADKWMLTRLNEVTEQVTTSLEAYKFSEAGLTIYDFFWGEFCDWYVEMSKVNKHSAVLRQALTQSLKLMHPFMPFVTESIWQALHDNPGEANMLMTAEWPSPNPDWNFPSESDEMSRIMEVIKGIRSLRAEAKVDATKKIHAIIYAHEDTALIQDKSEIIQRLANLGEVDIQPTGKKVEKALSTFVGDVEIYLPLADLMDLDVEVKRLEREISKIQSYLETLQRKLSNEAFIKNAPNEVLEKEKAKLAEAQKKLNKLTEQLQELGE